MLTWLGLVAWVAFEAALLYLITSQQECWLSHLKLWGVVSFSMVLVFGICVLSYVILYGGGQP